MNRKKHYLLIFFLIILIISCTNKKCPFNFEGDIEIITDTLYNAVKIVNSYTDTIQNYSENTTLLVGKYNNVKTKTLLKFLYLPDSNLIDTVQINSFKIKMKEKDQLGNDLIIEVNKLNKDWDENTVTWDSVDIGNEIAEFTTTGDSIFFSIDSTLIIDWIDNDSLNFGMILSCDYFDNNFVKYYSSENSNSPQLEFIYTDSTKNVDTIYYEVTEDAFIALNEGPTSYSYGKMANLPPTRMIIEIEKDTIKNQLDISYQEMEKISINLAEVIFDSTMIIDSYTCLSGWEFCPYYISDTLCIDEYTYISGTSITYYDKEENNLNLNITSLIQGQFRNILENKEILVKSLVENKDYSMLRFDDNILPELKIIYTKPIIDVKN